MNFADRPTLTIWQKLGCAAYFMLMAAICFFAFVAVVFDGWDEPPMPVWASFLLFPGMPIAAVFGGGFILHFFMKPKK